MYRLRMLLREKRLGHAFDQRHGAVDASNERRPISSLSYVAGAAVNSPLGMGRSPLRRRDTSVHEPRHVVAEVSQREMLPSRYSARHTDFAFTARVFELSSRPSKS